MTEPNATFISFKPSGKYYTSGRGFLPREAFGPMLNHFERRLPILEANGGKMPGLSSPGETLVIVALIDETTESYGWPLMLPSRDQDDGKPHM